MKPPEHDRLMPPAGERGPSHPRDAGFDGHVIPWKPAASPADHAESVAGRAAAGIEVFVDLHEVGLEGWRSLRGLVLACRRVVLWAPSFARLEQLRAWEPELPTPRELVGWVRTGRVQVLARENWLSGEQAEDDIAGATVRSGEYEEVLEILRQDVHEGRTGPSARVRRAPEEKSHAWAFNEFWDSEINLQRLHREALAIMPGYVETAARLGDYRLATIALLRDARNRGEMFLFSGANRAIESFHDRQAVAAALAAAGMEDDSRARGQPPTLEATALVTAIRTAIRGVRRAHLLGLTLEPEAVSALRLWVGGCDAVVEGRRGRELEEVADWLLRSLDAELPRGLPPEVVAMGGLQRVAFAGSVGMGLAARAGGSPGAPLALAAAPVAGVTALLERLSQLPAGFTGERWPYYVVEDADSPFRATREAVIAELRSTA